MKPSPRHAAFLRLTVVCLLLGFLVPVPNGRAQGKKKPAADVGTSAKRRGVPPKAELDALVRKTLLDVDKGLETKDFTQLYANLAPTWRKQISKEQLGLIFTLQLAEQQRTDYVTSVEPVYDPAPKLDARGLLVVGGHYPSEPEWVIFRIKYYNEGGWKPFGIAVRVQNAHSNPPPPTRLPEPGEQALPPVKAGATPTASPSPTPAPGSSPAASPSPGATAAPATGSPAAAASPTPAATATPSPEAAASPSASPKK